MDLIDQHLANVETALLRGYSLSRAADWIIEQTYLKGELYSFEDHEFQETIARDTALEVVVRKCAQIGMSELTVRIALAYCNVVPGFTTIYTMPTFDAAKKFARTRIDPIIYGSPTLARRVHPENNSSELKQFIESFLHIKGTVGAGAAISVPADCLIHDELDFSDEEVVSNYESRLVHSSFKLSRKFSTPTVGGIGISEEYETSKKHWNFVKCCHCNHQFKPDYFENVRIPGYDGDIRKINKETLWTVRWREAYVECPNCKKEPDLSPAHREWVVENTDYNGDKHGYQITPFDAPKVITAADLVKASTKYSRYADFTNFRLGLPAEDAETSFGEEELLRLFLPREEGFTPYVTFIGIDVGLTCHIMVGGLGPSGMVDILHVERCEHTELEERKRELAREFRCRVGVMDSQPYFDLLLRMQARDNNLWGAVYSQKKDLDLMHVIDQEKDEDTGRERRHQVDVNRNKALDALMMFVRSGGLAFRPQTEALKALIVKHLKDMKRIKGKDAHDEELFTWKKSSSGNDHFHHALLYCFIASRLVGTAQSIILMPFALTSFKMKEQVDEKSGRRLGTTL